VGVLLLFIVMWALRRPSAAGSVFWLFVIWYSVLRSVIEEPFRDNPLAWQVYLDQAGGVGLFTFVQLGSIPIILVALYLLLTAGDKSTADRPGALRAGR